VGADGVVCLWSPPRAEAAPAGPTPTQADLDFLKTVSRDLEDADLADLAERKDLRIDHEEGIDDAGLEHLARLVNLEELSIQRTARIRGAGLAHLAKLPKLRPR
jgi:hypothetical protein